MAFTEDLDSFLNTDDFAIAATYTPAGGTAKTVHGIFDNGFEGMGDGTVEVEATIPTFLVKAADVPSAAQGDALKVVSTDFLVKSVQPDGTGLTLLILEEQ